MFTYSNKISTVFISLTEGNIFMKMADFNDVLSQAGGVSMPYVNNTFVTLTFPSHTSIATGKNKPSLWKYSYVSLYGVKCCVCVCVCVIVCVCVCVCVV